MRGISSSFYCFLLKKRKKGEILERNREVYRLHFAVCCQKKEQQVRF